MKILEDNPLLPYILLTAFFCLGIVLPSHTLAANYFCWIKAGNTDANIDVRDMDRDGNPVSGITWKGQIESGQRQRIESTTGLIGYSYSRALESRKRGANYNPCNNGNIIQLK